MEKVIKTTTKRSNVFVYPGLKSEEKLKLDRICFNFFFNFKAAFHDGRRCGEPMIARVNKLLIEKSEATTKVRY